MKKPNILKPKGDSNFPYWPGLGIQNYGMIPGGQMLDEIQDIPINKSMYMYGYLMRETSLVPNPEALQDKKGATEFLETTPTMGRGEGVGLYDMLLMSVAQQQAQGVIKK